MKSERAFFPADAVVRRVDSEAILLLGGGRALLMQLAHPSVAAGVAQHSDFGADPFSRLRRTLEATYTVVFGTERQARLVGAQLHAVHDRVTGPGYFANDPELLMWVHATLVDTALRVHERFLGRLDPGEAERYYQESKIIGEVFGVAIDVQPDTLAHFRSYVRSTVAGLEVSDTARQLGRSILHPRLPVVTEPAMILVRQLTTGLLPAPLRHQYGLSWDRPRQATLDVAAATARQVLPRVPSVLRRVPTRRIVAA
ncbi:MAG TPA: oxygenase MpaB family protein [Candidatus Acidoferrum sp.]|nr:oxygenase MpaB family protein [Candidatus Acidoferrum sp.]